MLTLDVVAAAFLVRLFILFHDCVHGSLFKGKGANTFFGYVLGVLVFTPFEDWRFSHLRHHASYANLDARGFGDIWTLTRKEYAAASQMKRLFYRFYRSPVGLIGLGALFSFILRYRLKECYDAVPALQAKPPLTLKKSLAAIRLKIWDEERMELVGFS